MKYLIINYRMGVGYYFDENTCFFNKIGKALNYCDDLNAVRAKENNCKIMDLTEFYVVQEIKEHSA